MSPYSSWCGHLRHDDPTLHSLAVLLPFITLTQRKALLTLARCQVSPRSETRLYVRNKVVWRSLVVTPPGLGAQHGIRTLRDLGLGLEPYMTPLFSGFIALLVLHAPYADYTDVWEELDRIKTKEITAAVTTRHPVTFDYDPIFSANRSTRLSTRMSYNLPISRPVHEEVFRNLSSIKGKLGQLVFFPDYSKKTIGKVARRNARLTYPELQTISDECDTTLDLERIYHKTGMRIDGPTEMRWAWKFNDLKPRVYYARGPAQYYSSRIIQALFNIMLDALSNVHRFGRFHPETLVSDPGDTCFIYDYSSFTSSLHEIRNFTDKLADFYSDTIITIMDTHVGPVRVNLGEVLHEYNQECNISPDFDASQILHVEECILTHNAGMLGVPGNISSCTLLHGIHLSVILGSLARNKVVGDDAIGRFLPSEIDGISMESIQEALLNCGDVAPEKVEKWVGMDEDDINDSWNYVKRPLFRVGDRMVFGNLTIWPDLSNILNLSDPVHTVTVSEHLHVRQKKYGSQVQRLLVTLEFQGDLDERDYRFVRRILRGWHNLLEIPKEGMMWSPGSAPIYVPSIFWFGNYVEETIEAISGAIIRMPVEYDGRSLAGVQMTELSDFRYKSNPMLKLGIDLGYIHRFSEHRLHIGDEVSDLVRKWLRKELRPMFRYVIVEELPGWMKQELVVLTHVPHELESTSDTGSEMDTDYALDL